MEFSFAAEEAPRMSLQKFEKKERFAPLCVQSEYTGDAAAVRLDRS